jgi:triacylglycerol lipase
MNNQDKYMNDKEQTMMLFSLLAYYGFLYRDSKDVETNVKKILHVYEEELDYAKLVWGPVAGKPSKYAEDLYVTCALMYVVKNKNANEYTLVIRGTNPISLYSWFCLDINVGTQETWSKALEQIEPKSKQPIHLPYNDINISKATYDALEIHAELKDDNNRTVLDWLAETVKPANAGPTHIKLNITGHSLGGLLSTTLALWLHDKLLERGLHQYVDFNIYAFAAPTAGNQHFVDYTQSVFNGKYKCFINEYDIVTHTWVKEKVDNLSNIYGKNIELRQWEKNILNQLSGMLNKFTNIELQGYHRLVSDGDDRNKVIIESSVIEFLLFTTTYFREIIYQHIIPYVYCLSWLTRGKLIYGLIEELFSGLIGLDGYVDSGDGQPQYAERKKEIDELYQFVKDEFEHKKNEAP